MALLKELFRFRRYKNSQGRLIRRMTMAGVWVLFGTAAWKCTQMDFTAVTNVWLWLAGWYAQLETLKAAEAANPEDLAIFLGQMQSFVGTLTAIFTYCLAGVIALFGVWFGYRLVHWETFADFLISVEAEMAKVSWPGKKEIQSSTVVVLVVFLFLAGMILIYDLGLLTLFKWVGIQ